MMEAEMYSGERSLMQPLLIPKVRSPSGVMKHIARPIGEAHQVDIKIDHATGVLPLVGNQAHDSTCRRFSRRTRAGVTPGRGAKIGQRGADKTGSGRFSSLAVYRSIPRRTTGTFQASAAKKTSSRVQSAEIGLLEVGEV